MLRTVERSSIAGLANLKNWDHQMVAKFNLKLKKIMIYTLSQMETILSSRPFTIFTETLFLWWEPSVFSAMANDRSSGYILYKHGILGNWRKQKVEIQIRRQRTRHLIRVSTDCLKNDLSIFESAKKTKPFHWKWTRPIEKIRKSIRF